MQPLAAGGNRVLDVTSGQQADVADTDKAAGAHVQPEAASELERIERKALLHTAVPVVRPREGDVAVLQCPQAVMRERHPVSRAAPICDHLSRATEGGLGVDDPFWSTGGPKPALEGGGLGQRRQFAGAGELPLWESLDQRGPEETAEAGAEDCAGEAEGRAAFPRAAARHPALAIGRACAAGDDAGQGGVMPQWRAPGVQHGDKAALGS